MNTNSKELVFECEVQKKMHGVWRGQELIIISSGTNVGKSVYFQKPIPKSDKLNERKS